MILTLFRKIVRISRQEGILSLLRKTWLAILWKFVRGEAVFVKKRENSVTELYRGDLIVREGTNEDYELFTSSRSSLYVQTCRKRRANNEKAYIALVNDEIAYIMWVRGVESLGFSYVGQSGITVPYGSLYIYDCFTLPQYRGRRIYTFMLDYIVGLHSGKECYVACQCHTERSIRGIYRAGFQLCWKFYWIKHGPVSLKWRRSFL